MLVVNVLKNTGKDLDLWFFNHAFYLAFSLAVLKGWKNVLSYSSRTPRIAIIWLRRKLLYFGIVTAWWLILFAIPPVSIAFGSLLDPTNNELTGPQLMPIWWENSLFQSIHSETPFLKSFTSIMNQKEKMKLSGYVVVSFDYHEYS